MPVKYFTPKVTETIHPQYNRDKKDEQYVCLLHPQLFIPTVPVTGLIYSDVGHVTYSFINMLFISTGIFDDKLCPQILLVGTTANSPLSSNFHLDWYIQVHVIVTLIYYMIVLMISISIVYMFIYNKDKLRPQILLVGTTANSPLS
jgi:hypothetical protein